MAIIRHEFEKSAGLAAEIEVHKNRENLQEMYRDMSVDRFVAEYTGTVHGLEFVNCCAPLGGKLKILDIGVGVGQTSMYLALKGHEVTAVEPSPDFCLVLESMAKKANLNMAIHECSMESADFDNEFDVCIFNASFHHCENPAAAAVKCFKALKNNGKIFLINEQVLRFYKSKAAYYNNLKNNPGKVQHYGGNEHVYRNPEYRNFLKKAGFNPIRHTVPFYYHHPKEMLSLSLNYKGPDGYVYSNFNIVLRALWYFALDVLLKNRLIAVIARELSLTGTTFIGTKPGSTRA
jgi:2-polyprenyl-3-methyl-5-hydroxy-6-metoxy-1,4-benzoquinol methylase